MVIAAASSRSFGRCGPPANNCQSESDRRRAMTQKALEIRIQEIRPPVIRINFRAKNADDKLKQHRASLEQRGCSRGHIHILYFY